jgi:hypothetical protein
MRSKGLARTTAAGAGSPCSSSWRKPSGFTPIAHLRLKYANLSLDFSLFVKLFLYNRNDKKFV